MAEEDAVAVRCDRDILLPNECLVPTIESKITTTIIPIVPRHRGAIIQMTHHPHNPGDIHLPVRIQKTIVMSMTEEWMIHRSGE